MVLEKTELFTIYYMMQQIAARNMDLKNNKQSAKIVYDRKKNKQLQIITVSFPFLPSISHIIFHNVLIVMAIFTYWLSSQNDVSPLLEHIAAVECLLLFTVRWEEVLKGFPLKIKVEVPL